MFKKSFCLFLVLIFGLTGCNTISPATVLTATTKSSIDTLDGKYQGSYVSQD